MGYKKPNWDGEKSTRNCYHAKVYGELVRCDKAGEVICYVGGRPAHLERVMATSICYGICKRCNGAFEAMG